MKFPPKNTDVILQKRALEIEGNAFLCFQNLKSFRGSTPSTPLERWKASRWNYFFSFDQKQT